MCSTADGVRFRVSDTQKKAGDLFVHYGKVEQGSLKPGQALALEVDHGRRTLIRANHSATHLLHEALRQVLGDHVAQKGSLVAPDRLRFDFAHPKAIADSEVAKIEDIANAKVIENSAVTTRLMAQDEAIAAGARALFGEKYGDEVRVVAMGEGGNALGWSVELCGGTHVTRTGDIGLVGAGRPECASPPACAASKRSLARPRAITWRGRRERCAMQRTRCGRRSRKWRRGSKPCSRSEKRLERELTEAKKKLAMGGGAARTGDDGVKNVGDVKLLARAVSGVETKDLKSLADEGKKQVGSGVVAFVGVNDEGKASIVVGVTADLIPRFDAVDTREEGRRGAGRQGRRRTAGHGAGGRAGRHQGGSRA